MVARAEIRRPGEVGKSKPQDNPGVPLSEWERLTTRATPDRASACRLCGRAVAASEPIDDTWRACAEHQHASHGALWTELLGVPVSDTVGWAITKEVGNPAALHRVAPAARGNEDPWEHVHPDLLARAEQVRYRLVMQRPAAPAPHPDGRGCCWCGVATDNDWQPYALRWPDRQPGHLCGTCWRAWDRSGRTGDLDSIHVRAFSVLAGTPPLIGATYGLRLFVEHAQAPYVGTSQPWEYLGEDAPRRARLAFLTDRPRHCETDAERAEVAALLSARADARRAQPPPPLAV